MSNDVLSPEPRYIQQFIRFKESTMDPFSDDQEELGYECCGFALGKECVEGKEEGWFTNKDLADIVALLHEKDLDNDFFMKGFYDGYGLPKTTTLLQ